MSTAGSAAGAQRDVALPTAGLRLLRLTPDESSNRANKMLLHFSCYRVYQDLSLTTPTVSRDFISYFSVHEHTLPMARESRLGGYVVSPVSPQLARAVFASSIRCCPPNISSVTIDHDELCDLPVGRRVA